MINFGSLLEGSAQGVTGGSIDCRRREPLHKQAVAPVAQLVCGQQRDRLGEYRGREMDQGPTCIVRVPAGCTQMQLVGRERSLHSHRPVAPGLARLATGERQDCLLGLEIIQYPLAVGVLEVVGDAGERLGPVAAMTVADLGDPAAARSLFLRYSCLIPRASSEPGYGFLRTGSRRRADRVSREASRIRRAMVSCLVSQMCVWRRMEAYETKWTRFQRRQ